MLNKILSLLVLVCVILILVFARQMPNNPIFFFISSNQWIAMGRLILVGSMIWLSWGGYLKDKRIRTTLGRLGAILISLGTILLLATQFNGRFFDIFKPLDMLLIIEAGVVISLATLIAAPKKAKTGRHNQPKTA